MRNLTTLAALTAATLFALSANAQPQPQQEPMPSKELTIDRLYASPSLNGPSPTGVKYAPDGKRVTFLKAREEDSSRYDLWQFDVETGEQSMLVDSTLLEPEEVELSEEEKALRERKRIKTRGFTGFSMSRDGRSVVLQPRREATVQNIVSAMSRLRELGVSRLSLANLYEKG